MPRSALNLLLLPAALAGMGGSAWALALSILHFRQAGMPSDAFLYGGTRYGLIFLALGVLIASIGPGLLLANLVGLVISPLRRALDREAAAGRSERFGRASRDLLVASCAIMAVAYPIALLGGVNGFALSKEGIFYRAPLSVAVKHYRWDQVKQIVTQCYYARGYTTTFELHLDDGASFDLTQSSLWDFRFAYPDIVRMLRGVRYSFHNEPPPPLFRSNLLHGGDYYACPKDWPYFSRPPTFQGEKN